MAQLLSVVRNLVPGVDVEFLVYRSQKEFREDLWEDLRVERRNLKPVVVFGVESEGKFLEKNKVFRDLSYVHRYLSLPVSIVDLLATLKGMKHIYNEHEIELIIERYRWDDGLMHDLHNAIQHEDIEKIRNILDRTPPRWRKYKESFESNPTVDNAREISAELSEQIQQEKGK